MFDAIIIQMCAAMAMNSAGFMPNNGCNELLRALTANSELKEGVDLTEKYYVQKGTNLALDSVGDFKLKSLIAAGYLGNTYKTQRLDLHAPFQPFADNINLTVYPNYCNVLLNWRWQFK